MKIFGALAILALMASCSKKAKDKDYPDAVQDIVFNTKSTMSEADTLTMVKLDTPALFSTAVIEDGVIKINDAQLDKLKNEQIKFLEDIKKLSDQIEVVYRYQYTLNGFTLKTPKEYEGKIIKIANVVAMQRTTEIAPPVKIQSLKEMRASLEKSLKAKFENTSVNFIGVEEVQKKYEYFGKGLKVGIFDTGIDYTHNMFEGPGTVEAFKRVNPREDAPADLYPTAKVAGGVDLVGDNYNSGSRNLSIRLPKPDNNPIDISGHGSHVAGTVAGIGDGVNSYSGVAPGVELHSVKVFGGASTGDFIILAGFEYAADPNNDNDPSDALDVLNLSLGGAYGIPGNMYESAIANLAKAGIAVVASAGNSGDVSYITGSPATSTDALSVGASIGHMNHNWKFDAVSFESDELDEKMISSFGTASFTKPLSDFDSVMGKLVYAGVADVDFSDELNAKLAGNIALIDRGRVGFVDKVKRALNANATAVVIVNNNPDGTIAMGGAVEKPFPIPAVMVSKADGDKIKEAMKNADVVANLTEEEKTEKPELIDTLTGFSSRGPRSLDSAIKPEIVGPGQQIVSARVGSGDKTSRLNGTSMSGPHLAGVMTLMKQAYPAQTVLERKAILIGSAKPISDVDNNIYPVSRQGAGRVQVLKAVEANLFAMPSTMSLGDVNVKAAIVMRKSITLHNLSDKEITLNSNIVKANKLEVQMPESVTIEANSSVDVKLEIKIDGSKLAIVEEVDAIISFENEDKKLVLPLLAVAKRLSDISATKLEILASEGADQGAAVDLELTNTSPNDGVALIFNKLAQDERRDPNLDLLNLRNNFCDLQSAGYRILHVDGKEILEVAVKTFGPQEVWNGCGLSVVIDSDNDGKADQEVVGTTNASIPGLTDVAPRFVPGDFQSFLLDYKKSQGIQSQYEQDRINGDESAELNLVPALQDLQSFDKFDHSTVSIMRADLSLIEKTADGQVNFKVSLDSRDYEVNESNDFAGDKDKWTKLNLTKSEGGYEDIPASVTIKANSTESVELTKGEGSEDLIIFYPYNMTTRSVVIEDKTQQVVKPTFKF